MWWGIRVGVYDDRPCRAPRHGETFKEAEHPAPLSAREGHVQGQSSQLKKNSINRLHVKTR